MFHITYKLTLISDTRYYYYGKHSTKNLKDGYRGSGTEIKKLRKEFGQNCFSFEILGFWKTKEEALFQEGKIINSLWKTDPFCLNRSPGGLDGQKFDATGLVKVHKECRERLVQKDFLQNFLDAGWVLGRTEKSRLKNSEKKKGLCWIKKEGTTTQIPVSSLEDYLEQGWVRGRNEVSEETRQKMREAHLGKKVEEHHTTVRKDGKIRRVVDSNLQLFLNSGWVLGSGIQTVEGPSHNLGKVCITNEDCNKYVHVCELDYYLNRGWVRGRSKKSREIQSLHQKREYKCKNGTQSK